MVARDLDQAQLRVQELYLRAKAEHPTSRKLGFKRVSELLD
jgi:hypothetical protein